MLKDPARRRALDESVRARLATKERYDSHNAKRKQLIDELEGSERAIKRQRDTRNQERNAEEDELARIKNESQQLRQARASVHKTPTPLSGPQENSLGALQLIQHSVMAGRSPKVSLRHRRQAEVSYQPISEPHESGSCG